MRASFFLLAVALSGIACEGGPSTGASTLLAPAAETPRNSIAQSLPGVAQPDGNYSIGAFPFAEVELEAGEGRETVVANCSACHSLRYIVAQPPLSAKAWGATVNKMINAYGAKIETPDAEKIAAYLTRQYGEGNRRLPPSRPVAGDDDRGRLLYAQMCAVCHNIAGKGSPGVFPPLAGHAPHLARDTAGRAYLARLVLFGISGDVTIHKQTYRNIMPSFERLSDAELAAILNYVLHAWGNDAALPPDFSPFRDADLARARGDAKSPEDNLQSRPGDID